MSVRTYDPKTAEIFDTARCSAGCGKEYYTICRLCNLAYCFEHLKLQPHVCDTKREFIVLTSEEVHDLFCPGDCVPVLEIGSLDRPIDPNTYTAAEVPAPGDWDPSPKGCFVQHPRSGEICQLKPDGHTLHMRLHPNGQELECWTPENGSPANGRMA